MVILGVNEVKCVSSETWALLMLYPALLQVTPHRCGVYEETGEDSEHRSCDRQSRHSYSGGEARVQTEGELSVIYTCARTFYHMQAKSNHPLYFPPTRKYSVLRIIEVMNMDDLLL